MQPDDQALLTEILDFSREAVLYAGSRSGSDLEQDRLRLLAVVRLLEVMGEAANRVSEQCRVLHPELPWRQMVATRNRLIHGYRDVDPAVVAMIAQNDLPNLIAALEAILE